MPVPFDPRVATYDSASISFDDSNIVGAIQASGTSVVTLTNTNHVGDALAFDQAQIIVLP